MELVLELELEDCVSKLKKISLESECVTSLSQKTYKVIIVSPITLGVKRYVIGHLVRGLDFNII